MSITFLQIEKLKLSRYQILLFRYKNNTIYLAVFLVGQFEYWTTITCTMQNEVDSICPFLYRPSRHMFLFTLHSYYLDEEKKNTWKRRMRRRVDSQLVNPIDYQQPLSFLLTFLQQQHINFLQNMLQYHSPTNHWYVYEMV